MNGSFLKLLPLSLAFFLSLTGLSHAQTLTLKNGKTFKFAEVRVENGRIMVPMTIEGEIAELSYPIGEVVSMKFPEPEEIIKIARRLVAAGKYDEAMTALEPIIKIFEPFKTISGSYWAACSAISLECFSGLGKNKEFDDLLQEFGIFKFPKGSPGHLHLETIRMTHYVRNGKMTEAEEILAFLEKHALNDEQNAALSLVRGDIQFKKQDYEHAIYAYLRLPVFHHPLEHLQPRALNGALRCYTALGKESLAKRTQAELIEGYPTSIEATQLTSKSEEKQK